MRLLMLGMIIVALIGCTKTASSDAISEGSSAPNPVEELVSTLKTSTDADELVRAAVALCELDDPKAVDLLLSFLQDRDFLSKLHSKEKYPLSQDSRRFWLVLNAISKLPNKRGEAALMRIGETKAFMENETLTGYRVRSRVLIQACGNIRDPSQKFLEFLDAQAAQEPGQSSTYVMIFAKMRSRAACERIEKRLYSTAYQPSKKECWFTDDFLPVRDDPAIVALYSRFLRSPIDNVSLRNTAVLSLFDYKPQEWYHVDSYTPQPPARREAATEVLRELLDLADVCLKLDISEATKKSVRKGQKEIEKILDFRQPETQARIAKLISNLDDEKFSVREKASEELAEWGDLVDLMFKKALEGKPSPEVKQRILKLQDKYKEED